MERMGSSLLSRPSYAMLLQYLPVLNGVDSIVIYMNESSLDTVQSL